MLGATPMPHPDTSHRLQLRGSPHPAGVMSLLSPPGFFSLLRFEENCII
eukprot:01877.XXX_7369_7515_1 [CDS] Oithona nana genome sequencing.